MKPGLTLHDNLVRNAAVASLALIAVSCVETSRKEQEGARWLAGDHHIHSRFSVGWNRETNPPSPVIGGDASYGIPTNALMAKEHGLSWMVSTDHGGPGHSKLNLELAYPELRLSRQAVPDVLQFVGMELNAPAADHSSLIIPHGDDEASHLFELESRFDKAEVYPFDPNRDTEAKMLEALSVMDAMAPRPVVIANHPSRSSKPTGEYGYDTPAEFRGWNDTAPLVAVGMAGAPGHQARTLRADGTLKADAPRAHYGGLPTMGGFDPMTATLGGLWDALLGEGRRWWITANSDSHRHYTEGGADFWPGEYSKTYVYAEKSYESILEGIRAGRVFVTTGDLVSELFVTVSGGDANAAIGGEVRIGSGSAVTVDISVRDPKAINAGGQNPSVARVDLIMGQVTGRAADPTIDRNPTTQVIARFGPSDWAADGDELTMSHTIAGVSNDSYLRVRGTNGDELEPGPDPRGESPWTDLWFYGNPVFVTVE